MMDAAAQERFEEAAALRDAMRTVRAIRERQQKMATPELGDRDVFGVKVGPSGAVVQVFQVRGGRVVERVEFAAEAGTDTARDADVVGAAVQQFYADQAAPPDVHVPVLPDETEAIESWLGERSGRKVRIGVPHRGDKRGLLDLVRRNAELAYRSRFDAGATAQYEALELLQVALRLPELPRRIECFDISTIQGSETVASMVVCEDGRMKRGEYRKFRVGRGVEPRREAGGVTRRVPETEGRKPDTGNRIPDASSRFLDDFAAMEQVVRRRYAKLLEAGGPFPDVILIDGGKGQLNAAYAALESVGLSNLVAIGLAKKEELVFTRDHDQPLALDPHGPALRLLQRIRDEAHRFAVTFHRRARAMRDLRSELDEVPGVGPRRRKTLLTRFGSLAGVRRATREELTAVVGAKAADAIVAHFSRV
jgi:excinuclease ABC subunit C